MSLAKVSKAKVVIAAKVQVCHAFLLVVFRDMGKKSYHSLLCVLCYHNAIGL